MGIEKPSLLKTGMICSGAGTPPAGVPGGRTPDTRIMITESKIVRLILSIYNDTEKQSDDQE